MNKFILLLLLLLPAFVSGQNKKDLEKKKKQLQKEIRYAEDLLNQTQKDKKLSLNQLVTLNKKITMRQELIATINYEIRLIDKLLVQNQQTVEELIKELNKLKEDYGKMMYQAYKNRDSYNRLMFIFAAADFNQAYRRLKYYQQIAAYRERQAEAIKSKQEELKVKIAELQLRKEEKQNLLGVEEVEKQSLASEKQQQEKTLTSLQEKEKDLLKRIREKEQEQKKLQAAIQRIIEEEMRKAREAAEIAGRKPASSGSMTLTPEAQKLSDTFEANRGKLPWPVVEGLIIQKFGEQPHPVLRNITVKNNGITIGTKQNSPVRCVFEGTVSKVITIPGAGIAILVNHGAFYTLYSNLQDSFVKQGEKVSTKQNIGVALSDDNKTEVHFEIWKGSSMMNPEPWLFSNP